VMKMVTEDCYLLERLFGIGGIPISKYHETLGFLESISNLEKTTVFFRDLPSFMEEEKKWLAKERNPIIYVSQTGICFGGLVSKKRQIYIFGPFSKNKLSEAQIQVYREQQEIVVPFTIEEKDFKQVAELLCLANYILNQKMIDVKDVGLKIGRAKESVQEVGKELNHYQLYKSEHDFQYNPYTFELDYLYAIEMGNEEELSRVLLANSQASNRVGMLASNNKKQLEYMYVSSIALVTRAAIKGHMNPNDAYELADVYMQKLAQCESAEEMDTLIYNMQIKFIREVRRQGLSNENEVYIRQCKEYIKRHLRTSFQIQDIARNIAINPTYLSRQFSKIEGKTIQQYITEKRCIAAANMMCYTDYSIAEIAEYFCFSSQSHFGRRFKEFYGITPSKFRKKNRTIETFDNMPNHQIDY